MSRDPRRSRPMPAPDMAAAIAGQPCACSSRAPCLIHYGAMDEDIRLEWRQALGIFRRSDLR
jgi:hypothetical protein